MKRTVIALNKYGVEIVSKEYHIDSTNRALDLFDNFVKKNNIEYHDLMVKIG